MARHPLTNGRDARPSFGRTITTTNPYLGLGAMSERINGRESVDQLDDVGRRIESVIGDQDRSAVEHVRPHWEVVYDAAHAFAAHLVHLHGERRETTSVTVRPDGESVATCLACGTTLQLSHAAATGGDRRAVAAVG